MAKVHITLVGGQPEPVYKGIMHNRPDKVLFIYSSSTEKVVSRIKEVVKKNITSVPEFHSEQFADKKVQKIRSKLKRLFEDSSEYVAKDDEVTVNLTGGTKEWSILFFDYFKNRENVSLQLTDQNDNLTNLANYETIKINVSIRTNDKFALQGMKIKSSSALEDYTDTDFAAIPVIHEMREYNFEHFRKLTEQLSERIDKNSAKYDGSSIEYNKNSDKRKRNIICKLTGNRGPKSWTITSPNVRKLVTSTGWFEVEVARLLHKLYPQALMLLNCKLKFIADNTKEEKNETDIVMQINNKLVIVECKTQVFNISDVNKFNDVAKITGNATKPIFFTLEEMNEKAKENCNERGIPYFTTSDNEDEIVKRINEYLLSNNA